MRRRRLSRIFASTAVVAAFVTGAGEAGNEAAEVNWCRTSDAAWIARVLSAAGYNKNSCSGAAYVVGGKGRDLYLWATSEPGRLRDAGAAEAQWRGAAEA
jgi:hypothetical protein